MLHRLKVWVKARKLRTAELGFPPPYPNQESNEWDAFEDSEVEVEVESLLESRFPRTKTYDRCYEKHANLFITDRPVVMCS